MVHKQFFLLQVSVNTGVMSLDGYSTLHFIPPEPEPQHQMQISVTPWGIFTPLRRMQ